MGKPLGENALKEKYTKEIRAEFNPYFFKLFSQVALFFLKDTFTDICVENVSCVKNASKQGTLVYASNHRSYTDPVLLGLVLYNNNLKQPYYAAGKNMFRRWNSWLLKKSGAFSIDRANKDPIYLNLLKGYISSLLSEKKDILFYVEGGRSYDGKIKSPKLGVLKAILESKNKDVFIVPTAVNYEQVLEDRVLTAIAKKRMQRSFTNEMKKLIKYFINYYPLKKDGKRRYFSKVYVSFSDPISLKEYSETRTDLKNLAEKVIKAIRNVKHPTCTSIVSSAILEISSNGSCPTIQDIQNKILNGNFSNNGILEKGLEYLIARDFVSLNEESVYLKKPKLIQYYANGLN